MAKMASLLCILYRKSIVVPRKRTLKIILKLSTKLNNFEVELYAMTKQSIILACG